MKPEYSFCRLVTNIYLNNYAEHTLSLSPRGNISSACAISMWRNSMKLKCIMFLQNNSGHTLRSTKNRRDFEDDILKCILLNENVLITIKISLWYISDGSVNNIPSLVQMVAWRRPSDKPLFEPMMIILLTHWRMYTSLGLNGLKLLIKPSHPMTPRSCFRLRCNQHVPDFHPVFRSLRQLYGTQCIDQANTFLALHKIISQVSVSSLIFWHDIHRGLYLVNMKTSWHGDVVCITCEGIPHVIDGFVPVMWIHRVSFFG